MVIIISALSGVLSGWQHAVPDPEDPKEPLVSSVSFWHWLLDICHHFILHYSYNTCPPSAPRPLSLLLAPNLLWQLIMFQVLWLTPAPCSSQLRLCLSSDRTISNFWSFCCRSVTISEVKRSPSVPVSRAVINVFTLWSKCRYLQQLGPSVIFLTVTPLTVAQVLSGRPSITEVNRDVSTLLLIHLNRHNNHLLLCSATG